MDCHRLSDSLSFSQLHCLTPLFCPFSICLACCRLLSSGPSPRLLLYTFIYSIHPSSVLHSLSECSSFSSQGFEHSPVIFCNGLLLFSPSMFKCFSSLCSFICSNCSVTIEKSNTPFVIRYCSRIFSPIFFFYSALTLLLNTKLSNYILRFHPIFDFLTQSLDIGVACLQKKNLFLFSLFVVTNLILVLSCNIAIHQKYIYKYTLYYIHLLFGLLTTKLK